MNRRTFVQSLPALGALVGTVSGFGCNKAGLATELKLRPEQRVLYAQTVGYPAKG